MRVGADASRHDRRDLRAAAERPGVQVAVAGRVGDGQAERPCVGGVRSAAASVSPIVCHAGKRASATGGVRYSVHWAADVVRGVQHVRAGARRDNARAIAGKRQGQRGAARRDGLAGDSAWDGGCALDMAPPIGRFSWTAGPGCVVGRIAGISGERSIDPARNGTGHYLRGIR